MNREEHLQEQLATLTRHKLKISDENILEKLNENRKEFRKLAADSRIHYKYSTDIERIYDDILLIGGTEKDLLSNMAICLPCLPTWICRQFFCT